MIGDFGLAVAVDKSRLTQAGMMVGTVSYMPPEQAMGGEVGPRSDLYSLGAMIYEMVCGRPPFVGDETRNQKLRPYKLSKATATKGNPLDCARAIICQPNSILV
jgi:serine/threonine protein kinase